MAWLPKPKPRVMFQSTPPRGRRQQVDGTRAGDVQFQSTPPRGRRQLALKLAGYMQVSIHASTREATAGDWSKLVYSMRFNPRLHAGGDHDVSQVRLTTEVFQSTPPRGRRHALTLFLWSKVQEVSIHASTREAT